MRFVIGSLFLAVLGFVHVHGAPAKPVTLLNVSYDPTRELYEEINQAFGSHWEKTKAQKVTVRQSHGGSGKQARAVLDGLDADVVTLALAPDIDNIAERSNLLPKDWQKKLPNNSTPYTSTIVFLVRKGNPKKIKDWEDLVKPNVAIITPNPKTSGGARWNYLAAYGYKLKQSNGDHRAAKEFVRKLFKNVPVLDTGARGATLTFTQKGIGDVLIAWENEALLASRAISATDYEVVIPSVSILAEPPVAVVERVARRKGTMDVANGYLQFLYTEPAQAIAAKHYFRPQNPSVLEKNSALFPKMNLFTVNDLFTNWTAAQKTHFNEGGVFDQITAND